MLVLGGLRCIIRIFYMKRLIVMVVMTIVLPMQRDMRKVLRSLCNGQGTNHRQKLPREDDQQQEGAKTTGHRVLDYIHADEVTRHQPGQRM
jgi:hypothetical protein